MLNVYFQVQFNQVTEQVGKNEIKSLQMVRTPGKQT